MERSSFIKLSHDILIHPGESLAEMLKIMNISIDELANKTRRTSKYINEIIEGRKNITPAFALELEEVLNVRKEYWLKLQSNYDQEALSISL